MPRKPIRQDDKPSPQTLKALGAALHEYNVDHFGYDDVRPVSFWVHDDDGAMIAGLSGFTFWDYLAVDLLWVHPDHRGQGYGADLLAAAEALARERGCTRAQLDTFTFQAPDFYRRHGYEAYAQLDGYAGGHGRVYFRKLLG